MARKSVGKMAGETIREASVLVLVFGFLDAFLQRQGLEDAGIGPWGFAGWVLLLSIGLWIVGVEFELNRPE